MAFGSEAPVEAVLNGPVEGRVSPRVRATLAFLEKLTLVPEVVGRADIERLRAAGVSDAAIEDIIHVCAVFSTINRIANALDFQVPNRAVSERGAKRLLMSGYA